VSEKQQEIQLAQTSSTSAAAERRKNTMKRYKINCIYKGLQHKCYKLEGQSMTLKMALFARPSTTISDLQQPSI